MRSFDRRELALAVVLLTLYVVHSSACLARCWADPANPAGFPWPGHADY